MAKMKGKIVSVLVKDIEKSAISLSSIGKVNGYIVNVVVNDPVIAQDLAKNYKAVVLNLSEVDGEVGFRIDKETAKLIGIDTYTNVATFINYLKTITGGK